MRKTMFVLPILGMLISAGCKESGTDPQTGGLVVTDAQLYTMQQAASGWVFFGLTPDTLARGGNSAHEARLRVRYNTRAATQLDATGRVKAGAVFPDSSLIVKDLYTGSVRTTIAYMFKLSGASNAASGGWIWAETDDAGAPKASASLKGVGCTGCHSSGIDFTRMNDSHP